MSFDFRNNAELVNKFFASHCTSITDFSCLHPFKMRTTKLIQNVTINEDDTVKNGIVKNSNLNQPHDWDNLPIRKIKICVQFITY